uniref:Cholesterol 24-hydroxylase n=1 Tax=Anas zonorhyncha TaxID=75864 RepID=A0A8B9U0W5_9AVES
MGTPFSDRLWVRCARQAAGCPAPVPVGTAVRGTPRAGSRAGRGAGSGHSVWLAPVHHPQSTDGSPDPCSNPLWHFVPSPTPVPSWEEALALSQLHNRTNYTISPHTTRGHPPGPGRAAALSPCPRGSPRPPSAGHPALGGGAAGMAALGGLAAGALLLLLLLLLLAAGLYCCYVRHIHAKYDHIPGAPRESFLFGHLPIIWRMMEKQELIHDLFLQWSEKYGPVIRFNAFHRVSVMILSPEGVKEFLMSPQYSKDPLVYGRIFNMFGVRFLGNGLVTDRNYEHWHKQRKVMDPAFSRTYLIGLMETFNEKAEELMEKLEEKADGKKEFSMLTMMSRVTLDVIAKIAFGLELNALSDDRTPFPHAVTMIMKGMTEMRIPFVKYMPGKQKMIKEARESLRLLRRVGKECIDQRREAIQSGKEDTLDILTQILKGDALEETRDDENMLDNFVTFFVAGHETTANQLSFTVMALAQHPEIMERVQAEVDEVLGAKRDISYEDLGKLKYLSQVLKESLRLYPPVPGTVRWTEKENVIEGVRIPANTTVIFSTYIMGRMERYFEDPLTFNPDRFSKDAPKPYYSYFPFSLGPRSCIGQVFAQMEAKVVMAKLLQRFEFQLVPGQSFKLLDSGTLRPLDGVMCKLKPRSLPKRFQA